MSAKPLSIKPFSIYYHKILHGKREFYEYVLYKIISFPERERQIKPAPN